MVPRGMEGRLSAWWQLHDQQETTSGGNIKLFIVCERWLTSMNRHSLRLISKTWLQRKSTVLMTFGNTWHYVSSLHGKELKGKCGGWYIYKNGRTFIILPMLHLSCIIMKWGLLQRCPQIIEAYLIIAKHFFPKKLWREISMSLLMTPNNSALEHMDPLFTQEGCDAPWPLWCHAVTQSQSWGLTEPCTALHHRSAPHPGCSVLPAPALLSLLLW